MNNPESHLFLRSTDVVDWAEPAVRQQALTLAVLNDPVATAKACFEFVRDEVRHSRDFEFNPVTWRASDVLKHRTGYCYAKSHLLAALLRANGLPAGFCYQRLSVNDFGPPFCLHGFNAVKLPEIGWYRADARGNKPGVDAQFTPLVKRLAFALQVRDEVEFENVLSEPLDPVLHVLKSNSTWQGVLAALPDVSPEQFANLELVAMPSVI